MSQLIPPQEPVPLEDLLDILKAANHDMDLRIRALVQLSSVIQNHQVKRRLTEVSDKAELRAIATLTMHNNPVATQARWQMLMIIGEICRREHKEDFSSADGTSAAITAMNNISRSAAAFFAQLPWFVGALKDLAAAGEADEDSAIAAKEILMALPTVLEGNPPSVQWSKEQREASKDLMYLDSRQSKMNHAPFICRARRDQCANCGKRHEKVAAAAEGAAADTAPQPENKPFDRCAQCKAVFYCSKACQKAHWQTTHKAPCSTLKKVIQEDSFKRVEGGVEAWMSLFYENRALLYLQRSEALRDVTFDEYFMQYCAAQQ